LLLIFQFTYVQYCSNLYRSSFHSYGYGTSDNDHSSGLLHNIKIII